MMSLRELVFHFERQVYAVVFDVMLFSLLNKSLDVLALSLSCVSGTLVDAVIQVVPWLLAAFSGLKSCLRLLRA